MVTANTHGRRLATTLVTALALAAVACDYDTFRRTATGLSAHLEKAIKAHDAAATAALLKSGVGIGGLAAYEIALENLSPSDPDTTEILRLILAREPKEITTGGTRKPPVRAANATFRRHGTRLSIGAMADITPVEIAASQWSPDGVRLLIENGLEIKSLAVSTALTAAAANGCAPVITLLLDAGADVNGRDRSNDSPLAMARRVKNDEIVTLLISRGAKEQ